MGPAQHLAPSGGDSGHCTGECKKIIIFIISVSVLTLILFLQSDTEQGKEMAKMFAKTFVQNVYSSWRNTDAIYEKYNCEESGGGAGGGGEYSVQEGFGWTNGVTMYLLSRYPDMSSGVCGVTFSMFSIIPVILINLFSHIL